MGVEVEVERSRLILDEFWVILRMRSFVDGLDVGVREKEELRIFRFLVWIRVDSNVGNWDRRVGGVVRGEN